MTKYLDLDRQFMPFKDEESWEVQYYTFLLDSFYGCERWSDLLPHKWTVILAEAGAGKTAELRERVNTLIAGGAFAFYVTVNSLAKKAFRDVLIPKDKRRFDAWISSDEEGFFLIDSIDEARLNGENF